MIGVGRVPAVEGLNLEAAMIEYDKQNGVKVDDHLRTTNPLRLRRRRRRSPYKFTHLSDAHARIVLRNALFFGRQRASQLTIPWCTYTDPEIAHVGLYEAEAKERGIAVATYTQELAEVDRAVLDGETDGFVKVHVQQGSDQIVGATIVASHAGEMISELTTAIKAGVGLRQSRRRDSSVSDAGRRDSPGRRSLHAHAADAIRRGLDEAMVRVHAMRQISRSYRSRKLNACRPFSPARTSN